MPQLPGDRRRWRASQAALLLIMMGLGLCGIPVVAGAQDALPPSQWRLRFLAISCRSAPCPDWVVEDREAGTWFSAVVHFANPADARRVATVEFGTTDLLADGERTELTMSGRRYTSMAISRVVGEAPATGGPKR